MSRKKGFASSAKANTDTYFMYLNRLIELSVSSFQWDNLPDTVDSRYIELALFYDGSAVYFDEPDIGNLGLSVITQSNFDVYGNPIYRRAYSKYNYFQKQLTNDDSIIIWNNMQRVNSYPVCAMYAMRIANLDRIIDINANAQKTPILLKAPESQRLSVINLYKEWDGNAPVIAGNDKLNVDSLSVLKTDAPFVADKIYKLKTDYWNEALTYLGIPNINVQKKERMISDEVSRSQGGTIASRFSKEQARKDAVKKINKMFGTNIEVNFRTDIDNWFLNLPNKTDVSGIMNEPYTDIEESYTNNNDNGGDLNE